MTRREMIRVTTQLQDYWKLGLQRQQDAVVPLASILKTYLKKLRHSEHQLNLACSKNLELIRPSLEEQVLYNARSLRITLQDHETNYFPIRHQFLLRDFYQDLLQLEQEFADVSVDWDESLLVVQTETIILEDVELGHFSLKLNWKEWAQERSLRCLQVIAEEPNKADLDEEITHPHVRNGELCAGDALSALHKALEEGRLAEVFLIVHSVLTHYNPKSAYVRLDEWQGIPCFDCGSLTNPEDRSCCDGCDHDYCSGCLSSCSQCSDCRCLSCLGRCSVCLESCCRNCMVTSAISDQEICRSCLEVCPRCQSNVGPGDLHAGTGLCPDCHLDETETLSEEDVHETVPTTAS